MTFRSLNLIQCTNNRRFSFHSNHVLSTAINVLSTANHMLSTAINVLSTVNDVLSTAINVLSTANHAGWQAFYLWFLEQMSVYLKGQKQK